MTNANKRVSGLALVLFAAMLVAAPAAWASGVEIQEQGKGLGNSFAGAQAVGEDPSTVWWNPAGMARLERSAVAVSATAILAKGDFLDQGSFRAPGLPYTGETGQTDETVFVPAIYATWKLDCRWSLGLGVNAPFGLTTDYGKTWIGRYYGTKSALQAININPSVAYRINEKWSVGLGLNAMWAEAELGNAIDFGAAVQQPQALDGHVDVLGDSWGFGYNLGVLWEPDCRTRIGVHYRSRVKQELEGDADFDVPPAFRPTADRLGRFQDGAVQADMMFPDQIAAGIAYDVSRKWTLQGSLVWTNWSLFKELRVRFDNPNEPDSASRLDWEDTWRVALGVTYRPNDCWTFRLGTQWDQSPIPDETRTPRIPLNDRIWVSAGVGYQVSRHLLIDVSYAHLFVEDGGMELSEESGGYLNGAVDGNVNIFNLQLTWMF